MKEHLFDKRVVQRALQEGLLDEDVYQRMLDALPDVSHKLQAAGSSDELRSLSVRDSSAHDDTADDLDDDLDDDEDEDEDDDDEDEDEEDAPEATLAGPKAVADVALADRPYGDVSETSDASSRDSSDSDASDEDDAPTGGTYSTEP